MKNLAPNILRQRLLIEGFYKIEVDANIIEEFLKELTEKLELKTYGKPIIHTTSGQGKDINQGYDAFVPLIDSGIYIGIWANQKFLSTIIYTCKKFDEEKALELTKKFWAIDHAAHKKF